MFKVGDVVQLKSGSPPLTVSSIEGDWVTCTWFSGADVKRESFETAALRLIKPE